MKNSTFAKDFKIEFPDNFVECFIAEQSMVFNYFFLMKVCVLNKTFDQKFLSTFLRGILAVNNLNI